MKKFKFLVIGDLPLATKVYRILSNHPRIIVEAVLTQYKSKRFMNDPWPDKTNLYDEALKKGCRIFHSQQDVITEYKQNTFDFGISCRASIIYIKEFIDLFNNKLINMHGGLLPLRAGLHIACHSILEGDKYYGATLHEITEKIDAGRILVREKKEIGVDDSALTIYQKTQQLLFDIFTSNLDNIIDNKIEYTPQAEFVDEWDKKKYFNKNAIETRKQVNLNKLELVDLYRQVRGLDFPGHEPAYINYNGKKIYLTTRRFFELEKNDI